MENTTYFISIVAPRTSLPNKSDFSLPPPSLNTNTSLTLSGDCCSYCIDIDVDNNLTAQNKTLKYLEELSSINIIVGWRYFPIDLDVDI